MRTRQLISYLSLIAIVAPLAVGCSTPNTFTPVVSTSLSTMTIGSLPTSPIPSTIPSPTNLPTSGKGLIKTVTFANNDSVVTLFVGERLGLDLGDGYDWKVSIVDEKILSPLGGEKPGQGSGYKDILEARGSGQTELIAIGDPKCLQVKPPCGMPSVLFSLQVIVQ